MLYLIGLGLNSKGITRQGLEIAKKCKKVYLENYTVDFPYSFEEISDILLKKIEPANREKVENLEIVDESKKMDVALLIYGSPLSATTHISLIQEAKRLGIKCQVICSASIFDAVAETGLQLYKFGKTASMPKWEKSYEPDSFMEIIQQNSSIKAHSLILCDIGLDFQDALMQLEKSAEKYNIQLKKLIVCQTLGTKHQKIFYKDIKDLREFTGVRKPFAIILPSELHFLEREMVEEYG